MHEALEALHKAGKYVEFVDLFLQRAPGAGPRPVYGYNRSTPPSVNGYNLAEQLAKKVERIPVWIPVFDLPLQSICPFLL